MPPPIAALIVAVSVLGLFVLDRNREARTSPFLWLPVFWLCLGATRNISVWLGVTSASSTPEQLLEGSPMDRAILTAMIAVSLVVLAGRWQKTLDLLKLNWALTLFLLYCAASALWSDFPFVTFKRFLKGLGNYTMVLVVLTDPDAVTALKRFITRTAFLLMPASVLVIKYYPELGRYYDRWEGQVYYSGLAFDKNMLGCMCLIVGFGLLWRFFGALRDHDMNPQRSVALGIVLATTLYLFAIADSATSLACFALGGSMIVVLSLSRRQRTGMVHVMVGGLATVGFIAFVFQDAFAFIVGMMGRNTTLTGRTDLWQDLLRMNTNPWLGTGFESFFLGDRLDFLWKKYWWHPNEAHSGYIETYLTLGRVGLALFGLMMIAGYRHVISHYHRDPAGGSLRLAYFVVAPIYNITESAFRVTNPLWILFLLAVTAVPAPATEAAGARDAAASPDVRLRSLPSPSPRNWRPRPQTPAFQPRAASQGLRAIKDGELQG